MHWQTPNPSANNRESKDQAIFVILDVSNEKRGIKPIREIQDNNFLIMRRAVTIQWTEPTNERTREVSPNDPPNIKPHIKYVTRMDILELPNHFTYSASQSNDPSKEETRLTTPQIPQFDSLVVACTDQPPTTRIKGQRSHKCFVSYKRTETLPRRRRPYFYFAIIRAGDD